MNRQSAPSVARWQHPLAILALIGLSSVPVHAVSDTLVVPAAQSTVEGNTNNYWPFTSSHAQDYQQVYAASEFTSVGDVLNITEISFRLDDSIGISTNSASLTQVSISLSTTSATPDALNLDSSLNEGADIVEVFNGALTLSGTRNATAPNPFDVSITLQTPFDYDPINGNLLLSVTTVPYSGSELFLDAENVSGDSVSRKVTNSSNNLQTDSRGLVTQFVFTPGTLDTTPPVVMAPPAVTAEATELGGASGLALGSASAEDDVDGPLTPTNDAPGFFPLGPTTVTWSATDTAGNTGTATQLVTVVDTTPPDVMAPADVIEEATGEFTPVSIGIATATDIADGMLTPAPSESSPFPVGDTIITWSATDSSGNEGTDLQTITVQDTTPPTITAPADISITSLGPDETIALGTPTTSDAVGPITVTNDAPAGNVFDVDTMTDVIWTATDGAGNSSSATQKVTVTKLDTDGDGACDPGGLVGNFSNCSGEDNCPVIANPTQSDIDGDTLGDACDPDIDGDALANEMDLCPVSPIPESVPTRNLRRNRYALTQAGDGYSPVTFTSSSRRVYTTADTRGCGCADILEQAGYGGSRQQEYGCTTTTMIRWVREVEDLLNMTGQ